MLQSIRHWRRWTPAQVLTFVVAVGLILAGLGMAAYNEEVGKAQRLRNVTVQSAILADSVEAALSFNDHEAAQGYVVALRANPNVDAAGVYDAAGRLVAGYSRPGSTPPKLSRAGRPFYQDGRLVVTASVKQGANTLGSVYLRTIPEPFLTRLAQYGGIGLLIFMAALMVAALGAANASLQRAHNRLKVEVEERLKAEAALLESQRMEALAQLAVATERGRAALRQSEQQLEFALNAGRLGNWEIDLKTGLLKASPVFRANLGLGPDDPLETYEAFLALIHPQNLENYHRQVDENVAAGNDLEVEFRTLGPDGETRWMLIRGRGVFDEEGSAVRAVGVSLDITSRKADEERQRLLLDELNHRVKNTLATVQSIAMQTSRSAIEPASFEGAFRSRIGALALAHELLSEASWDGASLHDVIGRTLAPYRADRDLARVTFTGPKVRLGPNAAVTLNMAFHELATNAAKYGSLSVGGGRVNVAWTIDRGSDPNDIIIDWRETGGPIVTASSRRGFGSRLLEQGLAREFDGDVQLTFAAEGVWCRMRLPLSNKLREAA